MSEPVVEFIEIMGGKLAPHICAQAQRFFAQRQRVLIVVADERQARGLDDFMWRWDKLAFLPHCIDDSSPASAAEAVVITTKEHNGNAATVLIAAAPCELEFMRGFSHVVEFVPKWDEQLTAAARQRFSAWREAGCAPTVPR